MLAIPIAAIGALALVLTGCSSGGSASGGDPNAEFEFWSFTGIGQQDSVDRYLEKNPDGYCGLGGTGVSCPVGLAAAR